MTLTILLMLIGLALLLIGANYLVDSSVGIAKRAKISDFVIGITIVGVGTSAPELYISVVSALKGMGDIAIGNVIGSNICNTLLILGVTAIVAPFAIERSTLKRDIPFGIFVALLLSYFCSDMIFGGSDTNTLTRAEGIILFTIFLAFMIYTLFFSKSTKNEVEEEVASTTLVMRLPMLAQIGIAAASLGALIYGGDMFLTNAVVMAKELGMSDSVISITIVALGTSLPELVTCIIAAIKGNPQLALGNVIGSNIFNILMILGISTMIAPISLAGINIIDLVVLTASTILTFIVAFTFGKRKIDRIEGVIFVALYISYTSYLLMR